MSMSVSIIYIYKITQSPDFRCCCRLLLAEDPTDHCDRDLRIGVLSGSSGSSVLGLGRDSLCRRFWRDCLSLSRDLDLPRLRAVEPVEPLLNIRPRGLRSGVSESAEPRTGESPYRLGWERFGWESCRARSDLVLARPDRPRDLERLRNILDCPPPPPAPPPAPPPLPRPRPPLLLCLERSRLSWDLVWPGRALLPDLELPRPLLLSPFSRARLEVVWARFDRDLLRDLEPPKRLG